jgi:hypothetical protein
MLGFTSMRKNYTENNKKVALARVKLYEHVGLNYVELQCANMG